MVGIDSTFTHADGTVFAVTTYGDRSGAGGSPLEQAAGPGTEDNVVVLVQGHGGTKTGFGLGLAEDFAGRGYYVITFDNRGAGCTVVPGQESFVPPDPLVGGAGLSATQGLFTYSDMADDVVALLDHFNVQKAHIAGASMGTPPSPRPDPGPPPRPTTPPTFARLSGVRGWGAGGQITTLVGVRHPSRCLSLTVIMSASPLQGAVQVAMERNPEWFRRMGTRPQPSEGASLEEVLATVDYHGSTSPEGGIETFASVSRSGKPPHCTL